MINKTSENEKVQLTITFLQIVQQNRCYERGLKGFCSLKNLQQAVKMFTFTFLIMSQLRKVIIIS